MMLVDMKKWVFGFTMTEMLVVVSIISLLAVSSVSMVITSGKKARDQKRYKDLETIEAALYAYYGDKGEFPNTFIPSTTTAVWHTICTNNPLAGLNNRVPILIPELIPEYLSSIPQDPRLCNDSPGTYHGYIYISDGTYFKLAADRTFEIGDLCDSPGDKFYDARRGGNGMALCGFNDSITPNHYFCSIYSNTPDTTPPYASADPICW